MKVTVLIDEKHAHYSLIPETNVDKTFLEIIGSVQTAAVKRNGTVTFSVELQRTELGKFALSKGEQVASKGEQAYREVYMSEEGKPE